MTLDGLGLDLQDYKPSFVGDSIDTNLPAVKTAMAFISLNIVLCGEQK